MQKVTILETLFWVNAFFCILEYFWDFFNNDLLTKFFQQISLNVFLYLQGNAIGK